jgi:hypothetical protein
VNRVFGPKSPSGTFDGDSHLFNATYAGIEHIKLETYAYLLDLDEAPTLSTATYGLRAEGSWSLGGDVSAFANAAYARQRDYARNPLRVDLAYYLVELGAGYKGASLIAGREVLEGNGVIGFQTPLATLHAFQGWAETFLTKPPDGIDDSYVRARYAFAAPPLFEKLTATIVYHDFSAERGNADFGSEWDASLEAKLDERIALGSAFATYQGAGAFPDKSVLWIYAGFIL